MKMHDLAETFNYDEPIKASKGEKHKYYPSISVTEEQMPSLGGKEVGDMVRLTINAKLVSQEMRDNGKTKKTEYRLELQEGYCDEGSASSNKADKIAEMNKGAKSQDEE